MEGEKLAEILSVSKSPRQTRKKKRNVDVAANNPVVDEMRQTIDYENKIKSLNKELEKAKGSKYGIEEKMPVSKKIVQFRYEYIDTSLVDVVECNARDQKLLSRESVADILESIEKESQQQPGVVREKGDGRYEAIDGSRRLYVCTLLGIPYFAKIGDIPDEDVESLSKIGNKYLPISDYEWGRQYLKSENEFKSMNMLYEHFSEKDVVSKTTVRNRCIIAKMPVWFVNLYQRPNDISATGIIEIQAKMKDEKLLGIMKEYACGLRAQLEKEFVETGGWPTHGNIIKKLKGCLPKESVKKEENVAVKNKSGEAIYSKKKGARGNIVYELMGGTEEQHAKIEDFIKSVLG